MPPTPPVAYLFLVRCESAMSDTAPHENPSGGTARRRSIRILLCLLGLSIVFIILFCVTSFAFPHAVGAAAHLPWFIGLFLLGKIPPAVLLVSLVVILCSGALLWLYILARI